MSSASRKIIRSPLLLCSRHGAFNNRNWTLNETHFSHRVAMTYARLALTNVESAGGIVRIANARLWADRANFQPTIFNESAGGFDHASNHGGHPTASCARF